MTTPNERKSSASSTKSVNLGAESLNHNKRRLKDEKAVAKSSDANEIDDDVESDDSETPEKTLKSAADDFETGLTLEKAKELAFLEPNENFDGVCQLITGLVLRYIRINSARLLNDNGEFSPRLASTREVVEMAGVKRDSRGESWLDANEFPSLADIDSRLVSFKPIILERIEATQKLGLSHHLRIESIKKQFGLTDAEALLLCAVAAPQVKQKHLRLYQFATGYDSTIFPCSFYVDLLSDLKFDDIPRMLLPDSPLRLFSLIEVGQSRDWDERTPALHAPLSVSNRITSYLLGIDEVIPVKYGKIWEYSTPRPELTLPKGFKKDLVKLIDSTHRAIGMYGTRGFGRRSCIREIAAKRGLNVIEIDFSEILESENIKSLAKHAGKWFREARLQNAMMIFRCDNVLPAVQECFEKLTMWFQQMLEYQELPVFVTAMTPATWIKSLFGAMADVQCQTPARAKQPALWRKALEDKVDDDLLEDTVKYISTSYVLTPGEIHETIKLTGDTVGVDNIQGESLSKTLRMTRGKGLEGLAELKATPVGLDDVVLSDDVRETIKEILNFAQYSEVVNRDWGFSRLSSACGLSVLFSGPPGTGKTLTAGVIAHELKRALYVVDISRVVDKNIGETEKRLARIFDHAQSSQAILLFDEADSLFAKRTSVKSSSDRYANLEVNYLLQRLESYRGVSILTTNLLDSLDEALARRIQFKIAFPMPDEKGRAKLWEALLPKRACGEDIDFIRLGEGFEMSGGHIRNAVFRACIQAASTETLVDTEMLWDAGMHEYREMGHIVRDVAPDYRG